MVRLWWPQPARPPPQRWRQAAERSEAPRGVAPPQPDTTCGLAVVKRRDGGGGEGGRSVVDLVGGVAAADGGGWQQQKMVVYGKPHDYYRAFRADGSSRYINTFTEMVSRFDRLDFIELHSLVMKRFETSTPEGIDLILWGSLRTMFDANAEDDLWKNQEEWILKSWIFYDNCGVHILVLEDGTEFHILAERRHQELASPEQTASGKDFSNPLMADSLPKTIWNRSRKGINICVILVDFTNMALPPCDQRHQYLRYEGLQYIEADIADFESRLARIYQREVHKVQVFDFGGLPNLMAKGLSARMLIEHRDTLEVSLFTSRAWRQLFDIRGPLVHELILEFFNTFRLGEAILDLDMPGALQFQLGISSVGDFLGTAPSYTVIWDLILRLRHRLIACSIAGRSQATEKVIVTDSFYLRGMDVDSVNVLYILARYLRLFVAGRKSGAHIFGGQFIARLAEQFGLLTAEILGGLTVIAPELLIIDMAELVGLQIYEQLDDTWAWVAMGPERQPDATADTLGVAPPPPPAASRTMPQRMARLEEDVHEIRGALTKQHEVIDAMARDFSRFCTWTTTSLIQMMDRAGVKYMSYSQTLREYTRHPGSKFSIIVHEYVTKPSRIFTPKCKMEKSEMISKCGEDEEKSNLKTSLTLEAKNIDEYWWRIYKSGDLEVLES
ncbi:hypothetical protein Tco_0507768 [Tanacetum coccineum]